MPKNLLVIDVLVQRLTMDDPRENRPGGLILEVVTSGEPYEQKGASPAEIAVRLLGADGAKIVKMTLTEKPGSGQSEA